MTRMCPVVLQAEAAECGLACIAMILGYHGHDIDLSSLRQRYPVSMKGATLAHLLQISSHLELSGRPVRVALEALPKLRLPVVLHWDFNHFVVLTRIRGDRVTIHDPAHGKRQVALADLSDHFTGIALELVPTVDFQPKQERRRIGLRRLIGRIPGLARSAVEILGLAVALEVLTLVSPLFLQLVVDSAVVSHDRELIVVLGVGFLLLALVQAGIGALRGLFLVYFGARVNLQLGSNLFRQLLRLPTTFFERRHLGDVVSRFESSNVIQRTLTSSSLEALLDGAMALATCLMMFMYSPRLASVVLGAAVLYGIVRFAMYDAFRRATEDHIVRLARQQTHFLESIRAIQAIKLFGLEALRRAGWQNLAVASTNAGTRAQKLGIAYRAINGAVFGIENVTVIWLGALAVLAGGFSVGMLFAFLVYKQVFTTRISSLLDKALEFRMLELHRERVTEIALADPEATDATFHPHAFENPPSIEAIGLGFRYSEHEPWIFRGLDFRVERGESVVITGPSGCGKTTLLKVMIGLLEPVEGEVRIDGIPMSQLSKADYRRAVGVVMQEDQLLGGTIADNIALFSPEPDNMRIEECARLAAIHSDITRMPMRFQTLVGDMGSALSGGQKQRILLARALYRAPKVLFLDEATSHLDGRREQDVNAAIAAIPMTRVSIAHRQETIRSAQRVIRIGSDERDLQPVGA